MDRCDICGKRIEENSEWQVIVENDGNEILVCYPCQLNGYGVKK